MEIYLKFHDFHALKKVDEYQLIFQKFHLKNNLIDMKII